MIILLGLGIYLGYTFKKCDSIISNCDDIIKEYKTEQDSLLTVVEVLRDSLNKKIKYDTIYITEKYRGQVNTIKYLPVDSALLFFSERTSFMDGN